MLPSTQLTTFQGHPSLCAKTAADVIELKEYILTVEELPEDVHTCYKCGIVVGTGKIALLDDRLMADIKFWLKTTLQTQMNKHLLAVTILLREPYLIVLN